MKAFFFCAVFLLLGAPALASSCDLSRLQGEHDQARAAARTKLEDALSRNDAATVDLSAYLAKLNAFRDCRKKEDPANAGQCANYTLWIAKELSPKFTLERPFDINRDRQDRCVQDNSFFHYIIRNEQGIQILYHQNGSYVMTRVIPGQGPAGLTTGRTFLFTDGTRGRSSAYIVDFPEPLDGHDLSLYWGLTVPVGNGSEKLRRVFTDRLLTFEWSNGARVTFDGLTEEVVSSNFLAPDSYRAICQTGKDTAPTGKPRYFPVISLLPGAEQFVGAPSLGQ